MMTGTSASAMDDAMARLARLSWRFIPETPCSPGENMALDELMLGAGADDGIATFRLWGWRCPAIVLGLHQSVKNEVDLAAAAAEGFAVVRRLTGGGTMVATPDGVITYSLVLPRATLAGEPIARTYEILDRWVVDAIRGLGVGDASYVPVNDIACDAGKIGGAAQARRGEVVLHHTMIAYSVDPLQIARVLRVGREKLSDKGVLSADKRVCPLSRRLDISRGVLVERLVDFFRHRFRVIDSALTGEEIQEAVRLATTKYETPEWTFRIP